MKQLIKPMKTSIAKLQLVAGLLTVVLFSGCALTKDTVSLNYTAQPNVSKVTGAEHAGVMVKVDDAREDRTAVGAKINGFGAEMAPIVANGDVVALVQSAIETELTDRGFKLGQTNGVTLLAELNTFRNHFKVGFWAGDSVASVIMHVTVKNSAGTIVFAKLVSGQGLNPNIQLATGSNAKLSLDAALKDAMDILFKDKDFIAALLPARTP